MAGSTDQGDMRSQVPAVAISFVAFALLYLLFAGKVSVSECVAACACGLLAVLLRLAIVKAGRPFANGWWQGIRLAPRVVGSLFSDSRKVGLFLLRRLAGASGTGRLIEMPFRTGGGNPESRTRRALVVGNVSIAPNQFVTGVRFETGQLLVHQLQPAAASEDEQWPV
ncbi:hypothetical protein SAMN05216548_11187 [Faunimonas pinastri]|uniref:Uncharacterized protein n=1 Tax=Faunimonas pinastri TaxID=1855383 RepID=A0A1H9LG90_9HYPH|nr:hypothetical protein [Faunimonas pinastri]SER10456.1 hypothetical protein SAMN05216548_11187 [Faunimonas pinastri]